MIRKAIGSCLAAGPALAALWLVGAVFRDRCLVTAFCFYVPPLVMVLVGTVWLSTQWRRPCGVRWWVVFSITVVALVKIAVVDFSWRGSYGRRSRSIRVVHWNIGHAWFGTDAVLKVLQQDNADVVLLSECPDDPAFEAMAETLMPNAHLRHQSSMMLISRFPLADVPVPELPDGAAWAVRLGSRKLGAFDLAAVDLISTPWISRQKRLAILTRWVGEHDRRLPLLVLGDFNTPRDSIHFEPLREYLAHAYEQRGNRQWPYTWPFPLPVYSVDHAWFSRLRLYNYELHGSLRSDHRRQVLDFSPIMPRWAE